MVRWIDQGFNPEIWDEHTYIRRHAVHGFTAKAFPSGRQGLLDPPLVSEDGCPWRWFTNAVKEVNRGLMSETHW